MFAASLLFTNPELVRQGCDPHALTGDGVGHHGGGGVTHGNAWKRLRHGHGHRCHGNRHRRHGHRRCHSLGDGLGQCGGQRRDLWVEVRGRGCGWSCVGRRGSRGNGGCHQVLLGDRPWLQSGAAQRGVSLGYSVVVGAYCSDGGRQTLLGGRWRGRHGHHLGLTAELGILL